MKKLGWTVWGLIGLIFAPIGLIFLITGLAISTTYSFRSLNDVAVFRYTLCGTGALFFLLGAAFLYYDLRRRYRLRQAFYGGNCVDAKITNVREIRNVNMNGRHPAVIECSYTDSSGEEHVYQSRYLYRKLREIKPGETIPVYIDRMNENIGFVDVESFLDQTGN